MANTIALAKIYENVVDEIYTHESKTIDIEGKSRVAVNSKANEVEILKVQVPGLSTHVRGADVMDGDVVTAWETLKLTQERSRRLVIEDTDDEEALGAAFGAAVGQFMRLSVIPELDAYRLQRIYSKAPAANILTPGDINTTADFKTAYAAADLALSDAGVPETDRILFASYELRNKISGLVNTVTYNNGHIETVMNSIDGTKIVYVPKSRFNTAITMNTAAQSSDVGGFTLTGKDINFMLVSKSAVEAYVKKMRTKVFDSSTDDAGFRLRFVAGVYHDLIAYDNKVNGIFVSAKA